MTRKNRKEHQQRHLAAVALLILLSILGFGCANGNLGKATTTVSGGALGAAIAHEASDGDQAWTVAGAALGTFTALGANALADANESRAYRNGYEAGMNQSVKQQYWIIQNRQKEDAFADQPTGESFVPVKIPEQEINGEIRSERIIYMRAK